MHHEHSTYQKERLEQENDKIEEEKYQEAEAWADKMEAEELDDEFNELEKDPLKDPDNIAWMEEQMKKAKEQYGEDFGEDISEDFE